MAKLPIMSGQEVVRLLTKMGFHVVGRKGGHVRMKKSNGKVTVVVVPDHSTSSLVFSWVRFASSDSCP